MNTIHSTFKTGKNFKVGNFCVIEEDVIVGDNVIIGNFVLLKKKTQIGDRVFVDSYVRSSGQNKIGNDVTLRFGCTIARNVIINNNVFIAPNVMTIYDPEKVATIIGHNCKIYTGAVVGAGVILADNVVIGAQAFVNKNCTYPGTYIGVPARKIGS